MILIYSNPADRSACDVLDWLTFYGQKTKILHNIDFVANFNISIADNGLTLQMQTSKGNFNSENIKAFWYRRGFFNKKLQRLNNEWADEAIHKHLESEWSYVQRFAHKILETLPSIGSYDIATSPNKLYQLLAAHQVGLSVPKTLLTNTKNALKDFKNTHEKVITKSIERDMTYETEERFINTCITQLVEQVHIDKVSETQHNYTTILQNCVEKEFEIRTFYLHGKMWSMAIFSQKNAQTAVDFRFYDDTKPNRMVPYTLPKVIEDKIEKMMQNLGLNTGSIDIIYSKNKEYVFLEVNPVGQFNFVSVYCNYNLEKEIAQHLIHISLS